MISGLVVGGIGILGSEQRTAFVMIGFEGVMVREYRLVVMQAPHIDETNGAFGQKLAVDPFV